MKKRTHHTLIGIKLIEVLLFVLILGFFLIGIRQNVWSSDRTFKAALNHPKNLVFFDNCTADWMENWMLDGKEARVENSDVGMHFSAGNKFLNDTSHAVLWTKRTFDADLRIEFEYTRTDSTIRCVNILYFLATGQGNDEYPKDINLWNKKREVAHMKTYFNHMNTYHISYAAFAVKNDNEAADYIRMRRYLPDAEKGLNGTEIEGQYIETGLFNTGETFKITILKLEEMVWMNIESLSDSSHHMLCEWDVSSLPLLNSGRIGLRHMYTRSALYKNFKVWELLPE